MYRRCTICGKESIYGYPTDRKPIRCSKDKEPGMIDVKHKLCEYEGCEWRRIFGYRGSPKRFCNEHKLPGMRNLDKRDCEYIGCPEYATHGNKGQPKKFCKEHKDSDMERNKDYRKCKVCDKQPSYGYPGGKAEYCAKDKLEGMINVVTKRCNFGECITIPCFGFLGKRPERCAKHHLEGMKNLSKKLCNYPECDVSVCYGFKDQGATRCTTHQEPDMIPYYKLCEFPDCKKSPSFGLPGHKKTHCKKHKSTEMIDLAHKFCEYPKCPHQATYGTTKIQYCNEHKDPDMIDLKSPRCVFPGCDFHALYGKLFEKRNHCSTHSNNNEYKETYPTCEYEGCKEKPFWSNINYPRSCETHKKLDYKNIIEKPCACCGLSFLLANDLCNDCDTFKQIRQKVKENRIGEVLRNNDIHYYSADRIVKDGCSKHRPDYIIDYQLFDVIVEVDENQHKSYACECEIARMINIHQDFGGKPIIFIRYNPDGFKNQFGTAMKGNLPKREKQLVNLLMHMKKLKNWTTPLSVIYMYYDGYDGKIVCNELDYFNQSVKNVDLFRS
jgi:hypothetical protein